MPRRKPSEYLFPVTYRLTRKQIRKVQSMGGVEWLRTWLSKTQASRHGRDPVEHVRALKARNARIVADPRSAKELVAEIKLSCQQINAIRRVHRENPGAEPAQQADNGEKEKK